MTSVISDLMSFSSFFGFGTIVSFTGLLDEKLVISWRFFLREIESGRSSVGMAEDTSFFFISVMLRFELLNTLEEKSDRLLEDLSRAVVFSLGT